MAKRGAKKGEQRSKAYNKQNVDDRKDRIKDILEEIKDAKFFFEGITPLAKYVVKRINADIETLEKRHREDNLNMLDLPPLFKRGQGKITQGTLIGSKSQYRDLLEQHILMQSGSEDTKRLLDEIFDLKLAVSNLKQEIKAKDNFIAKNLEKPFQEEAQLPSPVSHQNTIMSDVQLDACFKTIMYLVEQSEGVFYFDDGGILHAAREVDNVIVPPSLLANTGLLGSALFNDQDEVEDD